MKRIIKVILVETICLRVISQLTTGLNFTGNNYWESIIITGLALTVASLLIKPVINILILPLNLITFGLFKWVGDTVTLYIVDLILNQFNVTAFHFGGYTSNPIIIPSINFPAGVLSYIAFSFVISLTTTFIYWLVN